MKDRFGFLVYRLFIGGLGVLPQGVMYRTGEALGRLAWYIAPQRRRLVQRHLHRILGAEVDVKSKSKDMFASYGRYWAEVFWLRPDRKESLVAESELVNEQALHDAFAQGKGMLLILPHMGNWEVAGAIAESLGMPALSAAENLPNPLITDWFVKIREMVGIEIVLTGRGMRASAALAKRLKERKTVALLGDRDVTGKGVPVIFFGEETTMPPGPVALAVRSGAPLLVVGSYFQDGRGHRFVISDPIHLPEDGTKEERIAAGVQMVADNLEEKIRLKPEDWHLFVPNWPSDREESS
ncbi:MAG: phosphatidylinositol mannoside acyltransferase [bacterium]|nr:phosphatidylinositol mannoside acyltransferase [bacterium]